MVIRLAVCHAILIAVTVSLSDTQKATVTWKVPILAHHHATGISMDLIVPTAQTHLSGEPVLAAANDTCSAPSGDLFKEVRQLLLLNQTEHLVAQPRTEECRLTVDTNTTETKSRRTNSKSQKFSSAPLAQGLHRSSDHASLPTHVDSPPRSC